MKIRLAQYALPSLLFLLAIPAALAANADKGAQVAQQWCANCHLIGGPTAGSMQQGPPSFRDIGSRLTGSQLRTFLTHPHGAMPDLSLTRAEIEDLVAYIERLR